MRATDAAIPQLSRLTDVPEAAGLLGKILTADLQPWAARGDGPLVLQAVTVLRAHPGSRWTLRYVVRRGAVERTVIAKVYARDRGDVAATLLALRDSGLGCGQPMQVTAPIAYVPALRLLLLEPAPGVTARTALRRGEGGVGERTARWLAVFHAVAAPLSPTLPGACRLRDPLTKARRWAQALSSAAPMFGREVRRLLAALTEAQPTWPTPPHLVHGDFNASHVFLATQTATLIDWDGWRVGDCAEDAGRFMASLHHLAARDPARRDAVIDEARTFAQTYREIVPQARRSLAFYEASACLRKAAQLRAGGMPRRLRRAQALLAAGARALAEDDSTAAVEVHRQRALRGHVDELPSRRIAAQRSGEILTRVKKPKKSRGGRAQAESTLLRSRCQLAADQVLATKSGVIQPSIRRQE